MSLASLLLDAAEKACVKALHPDHAILSSAKTSFLYYLHHPNFGPVPECPPTSNLLVLGHLPVISTRRNPLDLATQNI
jgi:hypothetical protein